MCDLDGWMRVEEVLGLFLEYTSSRSASVTEHRRREYRRRGCRGCRWRRRRQELFAAPIRRVIEDAGVPRFCLGAAPPKFFFANKDDGMPIFAKIQINSKVK